MDFMLDIEWKKLPEPIRYQDKIMLIGSCFTEHIGNALGELKFPVLQNPNGILFGPDSVCRSLNWYMENRELTTADLFQLNEVWHSWMHHSRFSHTQPDKAIRGMNESRQSAHNFLKEAGWLIITLGSSYTYRLTAEASRAGESLHTGVANCHRAPSAWFSKEMLEIQEISQLLTGTIQRLRTFNPALKILFTISPVRHIRDGVVENNRSKARLIESVHQLTQSYDFIHYFPAYELVIDVLRDYRFYDIDLVHPNYAATEFVLEKFGMNCIEEETRQLMQEVKKIMIARRHKAFQPDTNAHRKFLADHALKVKALMEKYPFLDLREEQEYFSS
jgi:GSCFA family